MMKVPPNVPEMEKVVLGACLIEKEAFNMVSEILRAEMFYNEQYGRFYGAMESLAGKGQPIDLLSVKEELRADNEILYLLTGLTNSVVSSAHILNHARHIVQSYLLRELIKIGGDLYNKSFEKGNDPFELIEGAEKRIHDLTQGLNSKDAERIDDTMIAIVRELEEKRHRDKHITGIPTGFKELDQLTCGWQPTDLVILAARPKCGKTAKALNLGLNAALHGEGVAFFSMEMSAKQLVKRILANQASMYLQSLRDARLDDEQMMSLYHNGIQKLSGLNFFIDDTAAITVSEFKAKARRLVNKQKVKLIIVDYLQLMQPEKGRKNQTREQEVSHNARQLKICAKELNVPIIALSQLSRDVEKRGSHVPQLSDLRESGAIEQDADMVCFLYKPTDSEIMEDAAKAGTVYFKVAAHRNGELKTIEYEFKGEFQRFEEKGQHKESKLIPLKSISGYVDDLPF